MFRRMLGSAFATLLLSAVPLTAQGPVGISFGGGLLLPVLDYGDQHDPGWAVGAGLWTGVGGKGLGVFAEGFYGSNKFSSSEVSGGGDPKNLYGAFGGATYRIGDPEEKGFFLTGRAGFLVRDSDLETGETDTNLAGGAGVGLIFPGQGASPWILGQFIGAEGTQFLVFSVGVTLGGS